MQLRRGQADLVTDLDDPCRRLVAEDADGEDLGGQPADDLGHAAR